MVVAWLHPMLVEIPAIFVRVRRRNGALGFAATMRETVLGSLFSLPLPRRLLTYSVQIDNVAHGLTRRQPDT